MNLADKVAVAGRDGWTCQAEGLHHDDCPGTATNDTAHEFVVHHRYERWRAKRDGTTDRVDELDNLALVWGGPSGLVDGCHGKIHTEQREALRLGLLRKAL